MKVGIMAQKGVDSADTVSIFNHFQCNLSSSDFLFFNYIIY